MESHFALGKNTKQVKVSKVAGAALVAVDIGFLVYQGTNAENALVQLVYYQQAQTAAVSFAISFAIDAILVSIPVIGWIIAGVDIALKLVFGIDIFGTYIPHPILKKILIFKNV